MRESCTRDNRAHRIERSEKPLYRAAVVPADPAERKKNHAVEVFGADDDPRFVTHLDLLTGVYARTRFLQRPLPRDRAETAIFSGSAGLLSWRR